MLGRAGKTFCQDESFDHRVRDAAELDRLVHYVECNPVGASLAANPGGWHWSTARLPAERACPNIWREPSRNVETPAAGSRHPNHRRTFTV
jgi:hypothetical protein